MESIRSTARDVSLARVLIGDGSPMIAVTGLALVFSGAFAVFLGATYQFLPHDLAYLEATAPVLCGVANGRLVGFMMHDRVAFGGALMAIGMLYLWLASDPLPRGEAWAWWTVVISGVAGFGSFLLYLGYGYLDTWHGLATLVLLPIFVTGVWTLRSQSSSTGSWCRPGEWPRDSITRRGRLLLLVSAASITLGGTIICGVGVTTVFVPQDLAFIGLSVEELRAVDARLIPLIAHDRAGFGGAVATTGLTMFLCVWCARPSRSLWETLLIVMVLGFGLAIGVHPYVGYNDLFHLLPAVVGCGMFALALWWSRAIRRLPRDAESAYNIAAPRER